MIGAGPAGLAAAAAAAGRGQSVFLLDDRAEPGGQLLHRGGAIEGGDWREWAAGVLKSVERAGGRFLPRATAYGVYDHNLVCAWQSGADGADRLWRIRPKQIILAAGAIERPLVLADNDRPGVMSADAALHYLAVYATRVGEHIAVVTNNDSAYASAEALAAAGADVTMFDLRAAAPKSAIKQETGVRVDAVLGAPLCEGLSVNGRARAFDSVLLSGGWSPSVHLFGQARGKLRYDEALAALVPASAVEGVAVAGAANGAFTLDAALAEGHRAGGGAGAAPNAAAGHYAVAASWPNVDDDGRRWIDFQNDVTLKDVALAAREGFVSVEHLKRYTTLGMATDQGKTSNVNGLAAMAAITGRAISDVGTTTYRPPFAPVPLALWAGKKRGATLSPLKRLPLEAEHRARGAQMREYGGWLRPAWYGGGDPDATIQAEAARTRQTVALFDGSSLGKIEVIGPDAAKLCDFHSYNRLSTLKPGKIRYGFMLLESGYVYDDGVTLRLADDRFLVSCSSGHTPAIYQRLELWRQDRFDTSKVFVHDATSQWATISVSGPLSRDCLTACGLEIDLADTVLPPMAFGEGVYAGRPLRVSRVSFTGDRSYELSVPANLAPALAAFLEEKARALGGGWIGLETSSLLRAEKGYIIVGKDTEGSTMPHDLGVGAPRDSRKDEYIGKRGLFMPVALDPDRRQLVGLSVDGAEPLPTGAHAVERVAGVRRSLGYVTSSYFSPTLQRPIALALIAGGAKRMGEDLTIWHLGAERKARVVSPVALDPEGTRLHA